LKTVCEEKPGGRDSNSEWDRARSPWRQEGWFLTASRFTDITTGY